MNTLKHELAGYNVYQNLIEKNEGEDNLINQIYKEEKVKDSFNKPSISEKIFFTKNM